MWDANLSAAAVVTTISVSLPTAHHSVVIPRPHVPLVDRTVDLVPPPQMMFMTFTTFTLRHI
jgi:hypothetical protein